MNGTVAPSRSSSTVLRACAGAIESSPAISVRISNATSRLLRRTAPDDSALSVGVSCLRSDFLQEALPSGVDIDLAARAVEEEADAVVADFGEPIEGEVERFADTPGHVGVGADHDGDAAGTHLAEDGDTGIHLGDRLVDAGSVQ